MQQFKIGDWVESTKNFFDGAKQIEKWQNTLYSEYSCTRLVTPIINYFVDGNYYHEDELKLWEPKEGEWCWFGVKGYNPCLGTFQGNKNNKYKSLNIFDNSCSIWDNCEPFLGELPSFLSNSVTE